jgi:hypothetical protein
MKNWIGIVVLAAAALVAPVLAQNQPSPLLLPPQLEKDLANRAANVTEVTLGKNMLDFAAKFMNNKDKDEAATKQLIEGLEGIYVRSYEFDKEGEYSMDQVEKLRQAFETPEWSPIVHTLERKTGETTDVLVKQVNGETRGMFVLAAEPKELTIVLILGPIRMDQLSQLSGLSGLSVLGDVEEKKNQHAAEKALEKAQEKANKKGGDQ